MSTIAACAGCGSVNGAPHTIECNFQHFLSYSGLWRESADVRAKLFIAYGEADHAMVVSTPAQQLELSDEDISKIYRITFESASGCVRSAPKPPQLVIDFARAILAAARVK